MKRRAVLLLGFMLTGFAMSACTPTGIQEANSALRTNDLGTARRLLEADREEFPRSVEVRLALGEVYYRTARDALDWDGNEGRYLAFLERSVDEFVTAAELDPKHRQPHFYFALMDVYRGDLDSALRGMENAKRLQPGPIDDTNIAEIYIYKGDLQNAWHWNQEGDLRGVGIGPVTFNQMLIRWVEGDLEGARRDFKTLHLRYPEMIRSINVAPLPTMPHSFEEFAGYCCDSPACGPYLMHACADLGLEVKRREVSEETLLGELRLELEKRRRLKEIYRQHQELELEVEISEDAQ